MIWLNGLLLLAWFGGLLAAYFFGRSDGAHAVRIAADNAQILAAERIADATANAPTNRASVVDRLRKSGL